MISHNVITVLIALLISISSAAQADDQLNQVDYPLISVPKGHYTLYIPDNNFFKLGYLEKKVSFDSIIHIGKFEVSNRLWNLCFKLNGCNRLVMMREGETLDSPVVRVNWHDAYGFSKWYSSYTNKSYRLPTEEEWVYAAYLGKDHRNIEIQYDYSDLNKIREISKKTMPLGSFKENALGFSDYQGNVWEWTLTCWYASEEKKLKEYSSAELNTPQACTTRIVQGENRSHIPDFIMDTYSGGCATLEPAANLGFRLVLEEN
ncbi:MAG: SUMF1/EgtB/PvdO family nonheme iron enzyme [Oleispira antarctica]|nr:SUMF1/EgtB/PvdO family nonheme iron enzyme [Oleispira antarctica]MBQ0793081.1 SUMF1/EgtB/PvdO family nonheme iron enzyme [Oleispira antarctica]